MNDGDINALSVRAKQAENEGRGIRLSMGETRLIRFALHVLDNQIADAWYPDWIKRYQVPETESPK